MIHLIQQILGPFTHLSSSPCSLSSSLSKIAGLLIHTPTTVPDNEINIMV